MKKNIIFLIILVFILAGCRNKTTTSTEYSIDKKEDSFALLNSLNKNIEYNADLIDNKKLEVEFNFRKGQTVPEDASIVKAKIYLYFDKDVVSIYDQTIYRTYEDYLKPVKLTFDADGKEFNRYEIAYEVN